MTKSTVLLFDLGGVLVDNAMFDDLPALLGAQSPNGDLHELWLSSEAVQLFERGEIGAETFGARFVSEWGLSMAPTAFLARFAAWPKGFFPGAEERLRSLREDYLIAYLSNSNAIHWSRFGKILECADVAIASHLCGLVKPDPGIFALAIERLGGDPDRIYFFDDSALNIEAARAAGMRAYQTVGFTALSATLDALGLGRANR